MMREIAISSSRPYKIYMGRDLFLSKHFTDYCKTFSGRFVIITEEKLDDLYAWDIAKILEENHCRVDIIAISGGEENKTREMKAQIEDQLLSLSCGRDTILFALGGGVILDLVGFIAATFCRGVPVIYLPTTLLAMVDACIGGKTGINTKYGKNLIGTFTQPHAAFLDINTLKTLPMREMKSGMAEVIKHAIISDSNAFKKLEENTFEQLSDEFLINMIAESCYVKKHIVEQDEFELNMRQLLNFGHTVGHAIETTSQYEIKHGEAIALGMLIESMISIKLNYMKTETFKKIVEIIAQYQILAECHVNLDSGKIMNIMQADKKVRDGKVHIVMMTDIGKPYIQEGRYSHVVNLKDISSVLNEFNDKRVF